MWAVVLITPPKPNYYPTNYFLHLFKYKRDALTVQRNILQRGGVAIIKEASK